MWGKYRRSASVGWYWRSSPSYLGSAGGAHGLTGDGGGSSRPSAIPIVANNCVAPMKEIFTRTPRISQQRFMKAHSGLSEPELASTETALVELASFVRARTRVS